MGTSIYETPNSNTCANNASVAISGKKQRIIGLDIIRVCLALLIFFFHSDLHLKCNYGFMAPFFHKGAIAMTCFFIMSGFSLMLSNKKNEFQNSKSIIGFYKKRFISIYPLYLFCGTAFVIMCIAAGLQSLADNLLLLPVEIFGFQSAFDSLFAFAHNGGTWFISCLFICYLVFPIIHTVIKGLDNKTKVIALVVLYMICSYSPFVAKHFNAADIYTNPFFRTLEFIIGALVYEIIKDKKSSNTIFSGLFTFALLVVEVVFISIYNLEYQAYNVLLIPIFGLQLYCSKSIRLRLGVEKIVLYASKISYAFFLAQFFVWKPMYLLIKICGGLPNLSKIGLSFILCVVVSIILHKFIEKPSFKYLKEKVC